MMMMKQKAREAFNELREIGAPVIEREENGSYFIISQENGSGGDLWANFSFSLNSKREEWDIFGVHEKINEILTKYGLYCEWHHSAGYLCVYDTAHAMKKF